MLRFLFSLMLGLLLSTQLQAEVFVIKGDMIGEITQYVIQPGDVLYKIARQADLGIDELIAANPGIDPLKLQVGKKITLTTSHVLPTGRRIGIVINLSELRLFYYLGDGQVLTAPISLGKEGWQTPIGVTRIVKKRKDPTWIPPDAIRAEDPSLPAEVPPGPDNPLGAYALNLGWPGYAIHGTNQPYGIGTYSSHGCIRLYPEDIEALFNQVAEGVRVTVIDAPYKLGWQGNQLFLEVSPVDKPLINLSDAISAVAGSTTQMDWAAVDKAALQRAGLPTLIGVRQQVRQKHLSD